MDLKEFDINKLNQKQKMMLPIAAILVIVVVWQVFSMFSGGDDFVAPTQTNQAMAPGMNSAQFAGMPGQMPGGASSVQEIITTQVKEIKPAPPTQEELAELENAKQMRRVYLTLLQQYQIASVQRLLAETRANIAASEAKLSKEKLEKVKAQTQVEQLEGTTTGTGAAGQFTPGLTPGGLEVEATDVGPSEKYKVAYIGFQHGNWSAIMMTDKGHMDVTVGTRLPDDSEVMSINANSVLIAKNMKRRLVRMARTPNNLFSKSSDSSSDESAAGNPPPSTQNNMPRMDSGF